MQLAYSLPHCGLIIRDAAMFDGTSAPRFRADSGVKDDRVVAVGDLGGAADQEVIATGRELPSSHKSRSAIGDAECCF